MRRWLFGALALVMCACLAGCATGEDYAAQDFELFMINVGKGDAIIARAGGKNYLIDAGYAHMWGRVRGALEALGITRLNGVFLTHADKDHAGGMMPLALSDIQVDAWYASGCSVEYKEDKHPMTLAAQARGKKVIWLTAGDEADGLFYVLAPARLFEDKEDNNSLVMLLKTKSGNALLTGDMEYPQERLLLSTGADLACDVLKVANHADNDATSRQLILKTGAKLALISTDPYEKPGTPDPALIEALEQAGMRVMRTDFSGMGISVRVGADGVSAEYAQAPERADVSGKASIASVDAANDIITLKNNTGASVDMSGWYLYSSRGDEILIFPQGTLLAPEGMLIGTRSSPQGAYSYFWDDKNVINDKKEDTLTLYDAYGAWLSSMSNNF